MVDLVLKSVEAAYFRGFREKQKVEFSTGINLIKGDNATGKSTILNAIEWCLFGSDIAKKTWERSIKYDERENWKTRNVWSEEKPTVILTFVKDSEEIVVRRTGKKGVLEGDTRYLSGINPVNFMHSCYLHQELTRGIIMLNSDRRKSLISRLVGLEEYIGFREVLNESYTSRRGTCLRQIVNDKRKGIDEMVTHKKSGVFENKRKLERKLQAKGVDVATIVPLRDAKKGLDNLQRDIKNLSARFDIDVVDFDIEDLNSASDIFENSRRVEEAVQQLKLGFKGTTNKVEVTKEKDELEVLVEKALRLKNELRECEAIKNAILTDDKSIDVTIDKTRKQLDEKKRIRDAKGDRESLVKQAKIFLEKLKEVGEKETDCPVCGNPKFDVVKRLATIKESEETLKRVELDLLNEGITNLEGKLRDLDELKKKYDLYIERESGLIKEVSEVTGREFEDIPTLELFLKGLVEKKDKELERLNEDLTRFSKDVKNMEHICELVKLFGSWQEVSESEDVLGNYEAKPEYKSYINSLEAAERDVGRFGDLLELLENKEKEIINEKLSSARTLINDYYNVITGERGDFTAIDLKETGSLDLIKTTGGEVYLTSVLNVGDMGVAALSVFLGLNVRRGTSGPFGFLIIDEPTQNLGPSRTEGFAKVLGNIIANPDLDNKQLIITTVDDDFSARLTRLVNNTVIIELEKWDYSRGVRLKRAIA